MEHSTVYGNNMKCSGSLKQQNMKTVKSKYLKIVHLLKYSIWVNVLSYNPSLVY